MDSLLARLGRLCGDAFERLGLERRHGTVVPSARPDLCQFQCNGAMPAAKAAGRRPQEVAQAVAERLRTARLDGAQGPAFRLVEVAGPGFINLSCADEALQAVLDGAAFAPAAPGAAGKTVILDFGGPNVAKPLHVGHLRSAVIGDSLQRLHRFLGARVLSDIHLGDWGTQMGMLICAVREEQPGLPYFEEAGSPAGWDPSFRAEPKSRTGAAFPAESPVSLGDLERLYPAMSARCKADPALAEAARLATRDLQAGRPGYRALWRHFVAVSVAALKEDFARLGVSWDLWLGESDSQAAIPPMLEDLKARQVATLSEGAVVIPLDPIQRTETPPLLLVKSDGGYLYGTTDLAALRDRVREHDPDRVLYVADRRQGLHFAQVFQGAAKAGYLGRAVPEHVAFGTVNGPDGKPYKTREGGVMRLSRLLDEAVEKAKVRLVEGEIGTELASEERERVAEWVAIAAVKFADLGGPRTGDYVFDLDKFTSFEGRTGPYLLYAAVRMGSILRKAAERGFHPGASTPPGDLERPVALRLLAFPDALARAAAESAPHVLCDYAYDLAGAFSTFYAACNILREEDAARRGAWLELTRKTREALVASLGLLGIQVPERM